MSRLALILLILFAFGLAFLILIEYHHQKHISTSSAVTSPTSRLAGTVSGTRTRSREDITEAVSKIPHIYHKPSNWNGRCIVFVHGLGGSKEKWSKDMEAFEKEGFRWIRPSYS